MPIRLQCEWAFRHTENQPASHTVIPFCLFQVNPVSTAVYVMAAIFLLIGVVIYYYVAYSHF